MSMEPGLAKRDVAVSMRFRDDDLGVIDRGAAISGLSRTEFVRKAAIQEAQLAILNETIIRLSPDAFEHFLDVIEKRDTPIPDKMRETLTRKAPWAL
jgi:uncharacterized protein (DUF1778 family)